MRESKIQELVDIELITGESFTLTIEPTSERGIPISLTNVTPTMEIRHMSNVGILKTISGTKTDTSIKFKITSIDSENWNGKLEYIVVLTAQDGNKSKALGYITMR